MEQREGNKPDEADKDAEGEKRTAESCLTAESTESTSEKEEEELGKTDRRSSSWGLTDTGTILRRRSEQPS